jgi:hypothetical protein
MRGKAMHKIYLYPNIPPEQTRSRNPYIQNLSESLSLHNKVVNKDAPAARGIFDIPKYLKDLDILYLNWIEDLPQKRGGSVQSLIFIFLLAYMKLRGKKIVWTLHNKKSHSSGHFILKQMLFRILLKRSDLIVTHASEGLHSIPPKTPKVYIPHPFDTARPIHANTQSKTNDLILWGTVNAYKGIDKFLLQMEKKGILPNYRIIVAGTVADPELAGLLTEISKKHPNVTLINRYIEARELAELIYKSKCVLFTYHSDSILSSGALMDSLQFKATVIGPDAGAFHDLAREKLIYVYRDEEDRIHLLDKLLSNYAQENISRERIEAYMEDNSWDHFSERITRQLDQL